MSTLKHGVSSSTSSRVVMGPGILYANYENGTGTSLGVFQGGEYKTARSLYEFRPAGAMGPVKGLIWPEEAIATIQANLTEITKDNLVKLVAGLNATAWSNGEAVGTGDNSEADFTLDSEPDGTILKIFADGVEQDLTTDYTQSGTTITFTTAPGTGVAITADYTYAGTPSDGDFWRLTSDGTIATTDYLTNLAFVCEWTGDATDGAILVIDNPLASGDLVWTLPEKRNVIQFPMTWTAHYDPSYPAREPWAILLPYNT